MSGIYIPNKKMPDYCGDCFYPECKRFWWSIGRPEDCPLVLVPDHGRLIDADALRKQMAERRSYVGRLSDPLCLIEDAPTVIEAEEGVT